MTAADQGTGRVPSLPAWAVPAIAAVIGGMAMTACLGPSIVDPRSFEWLMHGDYGLHFLGWHLYRRGPWTFPIGGTPLLIWPVGSSIGLTDSIPILAFLFKPLDAVLPPAFQFIGLWLVLSVALQGLFGALLMRLATPRVSLQLLGATLLILSPPLIYRINHAALTAHWVVLASLWLLLRPDANEISWRRAGAWALLCAVTAAIQPYLLFMVLILMAAAHARQVLAAPRRLLVAAAHAALAAGASVLALWQSGSLMVRAEEGLEVGGFGEWSTNLLSFIMPTEGPTLFSPGLFAYHHKEQYEGYAYLGAGILLLSAIVVVARLVSIRSLRLTPRSWHHLPLALALLFLTAMALGPRITAGGETLFTYDRSWWGPLDIFRTSGRMVWPIYYVTVIGILFAVSRFRYPRAAALLSVALLAQAVDLAGMVGYVRDVRAFGFRDPLVNRFWSVVPASYDGFALVPSNLCAKEGYLDFLPFALRAGDVRIGVNGGITARFDVRKARAYCDAFNGQLRSGIDDDRALYIVRPDLVPAIAASAAGRVACTAIDGYGVCFTPESVARWDESFDLPRSRLPDLAEFMRFYEVLDETYRTRLQRPPREVPGRVDVRVEALVGYVAYRMEGCDHREAGEKTLQRLAGGRPYPLCARTSMHHALPPADETHAFSLGVGEILAGRAGAARTTSHVDLEGEAVWLQAYAAERLRGAREPDARAAIIATVIGAGQ